MNKHEEAEEETSIFFSDAYLFFLFHLYLN